MNEVMTHISTSKPKAIKEHKCDYCIGVINIGEVYQKDVIVNDFIYTWKSHISCTELAHKLKMFDECDEGLTDDDFYEYVFSEFETKFGNINPKPKFLYQLNLLKVINLINQEDDN